MITAGALVAVHYGGTDDRAAINETIVISGDVGLESSEYVTGGNGTAASPYLIEDLSVLVSAGEQSNDCYGIGLVRTQAYLTIRNVTFDIDPELLPELGMYEHCGISLSGSRNVTVESCTFTNLGKGIMVDSISIVNASGNTFSGCLAGISFEDTSGLCDESVLTGNDFRQCGSGIYVSSWYWSVDIRNNSFVLCEIGIRGYDVSNLNITDNYIEQSKVAAISFRSPFLVNVERNHILYSEGNGIVFDDGYLITIDSNHIEVTGAGILVSRSTEITITRNEIDGTSMLDVSVGVFIDASTSVNVTFNALWHSGVGIQVLADDDSGTAVVIHHNGFFGNDVQAIDCEGDSNLWDDGMAEGNYWSDYTGEDLDSDGVGDTPYTIDSDSFDRYPLMSNPTL